MTGIPLVAGAANRTTGLSGTGLLVGEVEGYLAADYQPDVSVTFTPIHLSPSRRLPSVAREDLMHMEWAYRRFEK